MRFRRHGALQVPLDSPCIPSERQRLNGSTGSPPEQPALTRVVGLPGATLLGLGSILGSGVFVSIGVAAGVAGPAVILAIVLAAGVATCNALSSAQLAAAHPVSGGTYEYAGALLHPALGFVAGWMFLCAKSASAATAALGFAGYALHVSSWSHAVSRPPVAVAAVVVVTAVVAGGMRRSSLANAVIVSVALLALLALVVAGLPAALSSGGRHFTPFFTGEAHGGRALPALLEATALMFVAYTGYGRIATLGEEVRDPRRTIPRAIVSTLLVSSAVYVAVGAVAVGAVGSDRLSEATREQAAPLEIVARELDLAGLEWLIAMGAITAMLGVLLNLILGLSRVLLAMGRRGDMPEAVARLNRSRSTPLAAVTVVGLVIIGLTSIGSVRTTWSFSAFTVLVYYALTNLSALRLPPERRLYSPVYAWCGLLACSFLAFWIEWRIWLTGIGLIVAGLVWHGVARVLSRRRRRRVGSHQVPDGL